jgi:cob(I)alamin adenosyltransferase
MLHQPGYIHLYTGNGKGKTTAAIGLAIRAAGAGHKVWIGQFLKKRVCSEHLALQRFSDLIEIEQFGRENFIFNANPSAEDTQCASHGLLRAAEIIGSGLYRVVVLDEAALCVALKIFTADQIITIVQNRQPPTEIIITGRSATPELVAIADLVTEMREIKHYYQSGVQARPGIEY